MDVDLILSVARFALAEQGPLVALAGVLYTVGVVINRVAPPASRNAFWRLYRRTLPYHPVFAGAAFGHWVMGDVTTGALAGLLATWGRAVFRTWQKYAPSKE